MKSMTQVMQNLVKPYINNEDTKIGLRIDQLTASKIGFDGTASGLSATKTQAAIDEVVENMGTELAKKYDKTGGALTGDVITNITSTTNRRAIVAQQYNSDTGLNIAEIYANSEGGNLRLTKAGNTAHMEMDTNNMNGSTGSLRLYLGDNNTENKKEFQFWETGNFRDAKGNFTSDIAEILNNLGSKNLCPNEATTQTINDVVYTKDPSGYPKGTVKVNGTSSKASGSDLLIITANVDQLPDGDYYLSGAPVGGGEGAFWLSMANESENNWVTVPTSGGQVAFHQSSDNVGGRWKALRIQIYAGYTADNLIFQPMIRPQEVRDASYAPFAMSNKWITDLLTIKDYSSLVTAGTGVSYNQYSSQVLKMGNLVQVNLVFATTSALADGDTLFTLPSDLLSSRNSAYRVIPSTDMGVKVTVNPINGAVTLGGATSGAIANARICCTYMI